MPAKSELGLTGFGGIFRLSIWRCITIWRCMRAGMHAASNRVQPIQSYNTTTAHRLTCAISCVATPRLIWQLSLLCGGVFCVVRPSGRCSGTHWSAFASSYSPSAHQGTSHSGLCTSPLNYSRLLPEFMHSNNFQHIVVATMVHIRSQRPASREKLVEGPSEMLWSPGSCLKHLTQGISCDTMQHNFIEMCVKHMIQPL